MTHQLTERCYHQPIHYLSANPSINQTIKQRYVTEDGKKRKRTKEEKARDKADEATRAVTDMRLIAAGYEGRHSLLVTSGQRGVVTLASVAHSPEIAGAVRANGFNPAFRVGESATAAGADAAEVQTLGSLLWDEGGLGDRAGSQPACSAGAYARVIAVAGLTEGTDFASTFVNSRNSPLMLALAGGATASEIVVVRVTASDLDPSAKKRTSAVKMRVSCLSPETTSSR